MKSLKSSIYLRMLLLLLLVLAFIPCAAAQDANPIPVRFAGRIQSVTNGMLFIDQIRIDTTSASVNAILQANNIVIVDGILQADGTIVARAILTYIPTDSIPVTPTQVPPQPTTQPAVNVSIAGQIESVDGTLLTIGGQQVTVDVHDPILASLRVGDQVVVVGQQTADHIAALSINRVAAASSNVFIEGIIQRIDKDTVTVNDQKFQFADHDPLLSVLQIGDGLRIEGNYTQTPKGLVFQVTQATI